MPPNEVEAAIERLRTELFVWSTTDPQVPIEVAAQDIKTVLDAFARAEQTMGLVKTPEEITVIATALRIVLDADGTPRAPDAEFVKVHYRSLDALADDLRKAGVKFNAPRIGQRAARQRDEISRQPERS
jgi:hypothetical protein